MKSIEVEDMFRSECVPCRNGSDFMNLPVTDGPQFIGGSLSRHISSQPKQFPLDLDRLTECNNLHEKR